MAAKQARNLRDGVLKIKDGGSNSLTIPVDKGDLKFNVKEIAHIIRNRGVLHGMTRGQEEAVEVEFSFFFTEWRGPTGSATDVSPVDALKKQGNAASWASTLACGPYCTDLEYTITNPCSTGEDEVLLFSDFHADEVRFEEGEESNMISVKGIALVLQPSSTRS